MENQTEQPKHYCEYCGEEIKTPYSGGEFLTGIFGYVYCSEECAEEHINSK